MRMRPKCPTYILRLNCWYLLIDAGTREFAGGVIPPANHRQSKIRMMITVSYGSLDLVSFEQGCR